MNHGLKKRTEPLLKNLYWTKDWKLLTYWNRSPYWKTYWTKIYWLRHKVILPNIAHELTDYTYGLPTEITADELTEYTLYMNTDSNTEWTEYQVTENNGELTKLLTCNTDELTGIHIWLILRTVP